MSNDKQYNTNGQQRALQSPAKKARGLKLLLALLTKEFIQIRRNPFLPRLIMIFPITSMCVMPWVLNMEIKNIKVDVIDNDRRSCRNSSSTRLRRANISYSTVRKRVTRRR